MPKCKRVAGVIAGGLGASGSLAHKQVTMAPGLAPTMLQPVSRKKPATNRRHIHFMVPQADPVRVR